MAHFSVRPSGPLIIILRSMTCFGAVSGEQRLAGPACGKGRCSERCLLDFCQADALVLASLHLFTPLECAGPGTIRFIGTAVVVAVVDVGFPVVDVVVA